MVLIVKKEIHTQLKAIANLKENKVKFSVLIGSFEKSENTITVISAVHFDKKEEQTSNYTIDEDDINQLVSLKYILPYSLDIVGLAFYSNEKFSLEKVISLQNSVAKLKSLITFAQCTSNSIEYFTSTKDKIVKLNSTEQDLMIENNFSIMHTIECETTAEVLADLTKMKEALAKGFNEFWDKITFSKKENTTVDTLVSMKSPLDRIVEIIVPCDEKGLTTRTEKGNVFLAFDLHMNIYPKDSLKQKALSELKQLFNLAFTKDLVVKLQRSYYDKAIKSLVPPKKTTMRISGIECNTYISKDNPSKFEFDLMVRLINSTILLNEIDEGYFARVLLQDLRTYFIEFEDKELIKRVDELIWN